MHECDVTASRVPSATLGQGGSLVLVINVSNTVTMVSAPDAHPSEKLLENEMTLRIKSQGLVRHLGKSCPGTED